MSQVVDIHEAIHIEVPDGSVREFPFNTTPLEIVEQIDRNLAKNAVAVRFSGRLIDLTDPLSSDGKLEIVEPDSPDGISIYWHSTSHLMAQAVKRIWRDAKIAIGPSIDTGFYYDIDLDVTLSPDDLKRIEEEMRTIIQEDFPVTGEYLSKQDAIRLFKERHEDYKLEIINGIDENDAIKVYHQGEFSDLCRGPHLPSTGRIKHFKLISLAGAYWRGDERNKMLQRIYGISFPTEKQLADHLTFLEEVKKRDHRKLGKELDLFSFQREAPGFVFWHSRGMVIYNEIVNYWREVHEREGYLEIKTPIILNEELWHKSGHWDNYKDNMYFTKVDNEGYAIKPMNCPGGLLVYKNQMHSYRDLPIKLSELGLVHRHEKSGVLHGLLRVRQFNMDDAHIYCTPGQLKDEIISVITLVYEIYNTFGFKDILVELSTRPEKSIGSRELWDHAESVLAGTLEELEISFKINKGEGAFYGPKIDFHIKDCLSRLWQCGTVQVDFSMPDRLGATYINQSGQKETPVMIHRAILGSLERFIGILIEHYGGDMPLWLSPDQVVLIPVSEKHHTFAAEVFSKIKEHKFRVLLDDRNEKVGYKIRENELRKIPYMCILGDREVASGELSVRRRLKGDLGTMDIQSFLKVLTDERRQRQ